MVFGLGYTFRLQTKFSIGVGVDYSGLTQTTEAFGFSYPGTDYPGPYSYEFKINDRVNLFVIPGYAIGDKKHIYLK